jgi:predicted Zn-dependent protease with MMP-like domain
MITKEEKEEIMYNLHIIGDVTIDDEKYKRILLETLLKLPEEIREKILDDVLFIFTSAYGTTFNLFFPSPLKKQVVEQKCIILNPALQEKEKKTDEGIQDTIAHEIAHIILNHFGSSDPNFEKEADDLIEKWGFKRAYKDYTRFNFMREKKWQ